MKNIFIALFFVILIATTILVVMMEVSDGNKTEEEAKQEVERVIEKAKEGIDLPEKNTSLPGEKKDPKNSSSIRTCTQLLEKVNLHSIFSSTMSGDFQVSSGYSGSNQCMIKVLTPNPQYIGGVHVDFARVNIAPSSLFNTKGSGGIVVIDDTGTNDQIGQKSSHYAIIDRPDLSFYDQIQTQFVPSSDADVYIQVYFWGVNLQGPGGELPQASLLTLSNVQSIARKINNAF